MKVWSTIWGNTVVSQVACSQSCILCITDNWLVDIVTPIDTQKQLRCDSFGKYEVVLYIKVLGLTVVKSICQSIYVVYAKATHTHAHAHTLLYLSTERFHVCKSQSFHKEQLYFSQSCRLVLFYQVTIEYMCYPRLVQCVSVHAHVYTLMQYMAYTTYIPYTIHTIYTIYRIHTIYRISVYTCACTHVHTVEIKQKHL